MMPTGPLMVEHGLVERVIEAMNQRLERWKADLRVAPLFIDAAVDFIQTYADRCHHGKEEDIVFRDLSKKPISDDHSENYGVIS